MFGLAVHDYADITVRGIIGRFFKDLEDELSGSFAFRVGVPIPSNQPSEVYRWLGNAQAMRRWLGGRLARGLPIRSYRIENLLFENTIAVDIEDWRFDKTGQLALRFGQLAKRAVTHWDKLVTDALLSNGLAWDGVAFFSANHAMGGVAPATQSNALTASDVEALSVTDKSSLEVDEAVRILLHVVPRFYDFVDNAGEPYNDGLREVHVVTAPRHMGPLLGALRQLRIDGGSENVLQTLSEWNIRIVPNSRLSTTPDNLYFLRTDSPMKPIILQAAFKAAADSAPFGAFDATSDIEMQFLGEGSEVAFDRNQYLFGVKALRNVGYGEWAHAIRATLSDT